MGSLIVSSQFLKRFLQEICLRLPKSDTSAVENSFISKQVLDHANYLRLGSLLFFVFFCFRFDKERFSFLDIIAQVFCLLFVVSCDSADYEELGKVMTLTDQVRDFFKLL